MTQGESKLSRRIMEELRARGVFCFKVHGGPTMMAGLPDIIACVPVLAAVIVRGVGVADADARGLFIGFETKTPEGGDPTPIQQRVHTNVRAAHGQVYVVRSPADAIRALEALGWHGPADTPPNAR